MLLNAKNGTVEIEKTDMNYISFGNGNEILIILPGLGDGMITVKGKAIPYSIAYREYVRDYKVYIFSRKNQLKEGYSTRDMARDQAEVMKKLGIIKANILGISHGGMVAQYLAIDYPELVKKLILVVTSSNQNKILGNVIGNWIELAKSDKYMDIIIDTTEKSYPKTKLKSHHLLYPIIGRIGKPRSFTRFIIQANSSIHHNSYEELHKIKSPTLVIGGEKDEIVGLESSLEIAKKIVSSELFVYSDFGNALYEEAKDFNSRIIKFLKK